MAGTCTRCRTAPLVSFESKRTQLCYPCRQLARAEAPVETPVGDRGGKPVTHPLGVTAAASARARHPAGKRWIALVEAPCFFHRRPNKFTCEECIADGERVRELQSIEGEF